MGSPGRNASRTMGPPTIDPAVVNMSRTNGGQLAGFRVLAQFRDVHGGRRSFEMRNHVEFLVRLPDQQRREVNIMGYERGPASSSDGLAHPIFDGPEHAVTGSVSAPQNSIERNRIGFTV